MFTVSSKLKEQLQKVGVLQMMIKKRKKLFGILGYASSAERFCLFM